MPDLHLKLLREAGRFGDGTGKREPCVHCGGTGGWLGVAAGCPFCDGSGWEFIGQPPVLTSEGGPIPRLGGLLPSCERGPMEATCGKPGCPECALLAEQGDGDA